MELSSRPQNYKYVTILGLALGVVLAIFPAESLKSVIMIIAALIIISSLSSMWQYHKAGVANPNMAGNVITLIIGLVLGLSPLFFIGVLMTILSVSMLLASLSQLFVLNKLNKGGHSISPYTYISPSILLLLSITMLVAPISSVVTLTTMLGCGIAIYFLLELIISFRN